LPFGAARVNCTVRSSIFFTPAGVSTPLKADSAFDLPVGSDWSL
jgi:hypothetical protein